MKRVIIQLALIFSTGNILMGQNFTVTGGLVLSDVVYFVDSTTIETNKKTGFAFGISNEIKLAENFYQVLGMEFAQRGYRIRGEYSKFDVRLNYVNVPLNWRYKFDLDDIFMTFDAGPFAAIAFSGKITTDGSSEKLDFGTSTGQIHYIDYGIKLGYQVEFESLRIGIGYNIGLKDIAAGKTEVLKNRSFTFHLGIGL